MKLGCYVKLLVDQLYIVNYNLKNRMLLSLIGYMGGVQFSPLPFFSDFLVLPLLQSFFISCYAVLQFHRCLALLVSCYSCLVILSIKSMVASVSA